MRVEAEIEAARELLEDILKTTSLEGWLVKITSKESLVPLSVMAVAHIKPKDMGNAVGLFNLTRELGGSIGLAWMSTQLSGNMKIFDFAIKSNIVEGSSILQNQLNIMRTIFEGKVPKSLDAAREFLTNRIHLQSTIEAFDKGFLELALLFSTAFIIIALLMKQKKDAVNLEGMH